MYMYVILQSFHFTKIVIESQSSYVGKNQYAKPGWDWQVEREEPTELPIYGSVQTDSPAIGIYLVFN